MCLYFLHFELETTLEKMKNDPTYFFIAISPFSPFLFKRITYALSSFLFCAAEMNSVSFFLYISHLTLYLTYFLSPVGFRFWENFMSAFKRRLRIWNNFALQFLIQLLAKSQQKDAVALTSQKIQVSWKQGKIRLNDELTGFSE